MLIEISWYWPIQKLLAYLIGWRHLLQQVARAGPKPPAGPPPLLQLVATRIAPRAIAAAGVATEPSCLWRRLRVDTCPAAMPRLLVRSLGSCAAALHAGQAADAPHARHLCMPTRRGRLRQPARPCSDLQRLQWPNRPPWWPPRQPTAAASRRPRSGLIACVMQQAGSHTSVDV